MAVTNHLRAMTFAAIYPNTNEPFQRLIMAAADAGKNAGKKSWFGFGEDKGKKSFIKFINLTTGDVANGLRKDGHLRADNTPEELFNAVMSAKRHFQEAYPNWQDAYAFIDWFEEYTNGH